MMGLMIWQYVLLITDMCILELQIQVMASCICIMELMDLAQMLLQH